MKIKMPDGFWKAALRVGGLATVALFVLWSLYDKILDKLLLSRLGETNTMIFMVLMTVLIFVVAIAGMGLWYLNNRNNGEAGAGTTGRGETSVNFEVPPNWTFHMASEALARAAQSAIDFKGFEEPELNAQLRPHRLTTETTLVALQRLGKQARTPIRPYRVVKEDAIYRLTARGKRS